MIRDPKPPSSEIPSRRCSRRTTTQLRARLLPNVKDDAGRVHQALSCRAQASDRWSCIDTSAEPVVKQAYVVNGPGQPLIEEIFGDPSWLTACRWLFRQRVKPARRPRSRVIGIRSTRR